eukprot:scaffold344_cov178-Ochromonas_danica.AAC.9
MPSSTMISLTEVGEDDFLVPKDVDLSEACDSTSLGLIAMGPRVYGLASEGVVWIQNRRSDQSPNYPKMILFYIIPHLNIALRVEILYFTTLGIMHAAKDIETNVDLSSQVDGRRTTELRSEENRCYSFDEHPSSGLRGSLTDDLQAVRSGRGAAHLTGAELTSINRASSTNANQTAMISGFEKFEEQQNKAVTLAVEAALLESAELMRFQMQSTNTTSSLRFPSVNGGSNRGTIEQSSNSIQLKAINEGKPAQSSHTITSPIASHNPMLSDDTRDVEFSIMHREAKDSSDSSDSHHWQRVVESKTSNDFPRESRIPSGARTVHANSKSSATEMLRTMLNNAIVNARSVFTSAHRDFRFKDFCPKLFAAVRAMHNISAEDYAKSFETTCRERFSEGRSGAFLFYSSDQRFLVKTTTHEESNTLQALMPLYVAHLERHPNSLLVRFLGCHCLTMYGVEIHVLVMLNFFPTTPLSERYDLKGSWVNRHGMTGKTRTKAERIRRQVLQQAPLYFDNDLQQKFSLDPAVAKAMADQIQADIIFLRDQNRMDYSLLIGVKRERFEVMNGTVAENRPSSPSVPPWHLSALRGGEDRFRREVDGGIRAPVVEGPGVFYFGIIDILQAWNWKKRLERFFKMYFKFRDGNGLSAINSKDYADRFFKRCVVDAFEGIDEQEALASWLARSNNTAFEGIAPRPDLKERPSDAEGDENVPSDTATCQTNGTNPGSGLRQVRPMQV